MIIKDRKIYEVRVKHGCNNIGWSRDLVLILKTHTYNDLIVSKIYRYVDR